MNTSKCLLLIIVFSFCFASCDPYFSIDFSVQNSTPYNLQIIHGHLNSSPQDTSIISSGTKLVFTNDSGRGAYTEDILDDIIIIPEIKVTTTDGKVMNQDASDISNWRIMFPDNKHGTGEVMFEVRKEFFD